MRVGQSEINMVEKTKKRPHHASIHITGMTCTTCAATVEKALAETEEEMKAAGATVLAVVTDVSKAGDVEALAHAR